MIRYNLICSKNHSFESWFRNSDAFLKQVDSKSITCPECHDNDISKDLMSPNIPKKKSAQRDGVLLNKNTKKINEAIRKIRDEITNNSEDVGNDFPDEARKIHYNEAEERAIHGTANLDDIKELHQEGIEVIKIPDIPDEKN
tara:strand:- start:3137 stop:3562 length:426 start_codon:yes stop_codon:yes gene_type:complete